MTESIFTLLDFIEDNLWSFIGFPVIILLGLYLSYLTSFVQIRRFPEAVKTFWSFLRQKSCESTGVHPLKAFFACIGGCIGIGNIVAVCSAIQIGGPGALFWVWVVAILGMTMKYAEVYLGIRYRVKNDEGSYDGGPMFFLRRVFKSHWVPTTVALLLGIYGLEIYQFRVVAESVSVNWGINYFIVAFILLGLVLYAGAGGVRRVGEISSAIIPMFILVFLSMGMWVLINNAAAIPSAIALVFKSAFTGHAAAGGFVGSTLMMTISQGIRRGCYASDVGIGYAAVIHSESCSVIPEKQSSLIFIDLFLDIFVVSTMSVLLIVVTGLWNQGIPETQIVQVALGQYFPYMGLFMPFFILLLGYSTIIAYFCVGLKCAQYLFPKWGKVAFFTFGGFFFLIFSFFEIRHAMTVMSLVQVLLLFFNSIGIYFLRKDVSYEIEPVAAC